MDAARNDRLILLAILVSAFSVAWSLAAGLVAIVAARGSHGSPSLVGFGLAAAIDATASLVLLWYFGVRARDPVRAERLERFALRSVGAMLILASGYVTFRSVHLLLQGTASEVSAVGIAIAAASVAVLPLVAVAKLRLAARIPSPALRSDGVLTAGSAALAAVALAAVAFVGGRGTWWLDPAAALVIAAVLVVEGTRTLRTDAG